MQDVLSDIRQALKDNVDEKTKKSFSHFFKEEVTGYGVRMPIVNKISKEAFQLIKDKPKTEIWNLCEELFKSGCFEESIIACHWSDFLRKSFEPSDFKIFEHWVNNYVSNWATCDTLCNHTVGDFVMMYPEYVNELKRWAKSDNRWVKRAAAVTFIIPARKGIFIEEIFEIADILLLDKDDLVQKGYGWMLKAASETYNKDNTCQKMVFNYVMKNKSVMPRTALRYAIEKMPADMKAEAMKK